MSVAIPARVGAYALAALVSVLATGVVMAVEPVAGYLPMLYLAAVALVYAYAGVRPAVFTIVLCTLATLVLTPAHFFGAGAFQDLIKLAIFVLVASVFLWLMDVARRRQQQANERLSEFSTLLESMPEAVLLFNREGIVLEANSAARRLAPTELRGKHVTELAGMAAAEQGGRPLEEERLVVLRALRGETVRHEQRLLRLPQGDLETLISASPVLGLNGEVLGALVLMQDVTELLELQRRLEEGERHHALGQIAAGLAHDFNNVLDTISQAATLVDVKAHASESDRGLYLRMIENAVQRGAEIVRRLREYVRGAAEERGPVDARRVLEEALELTEPLWRGNPRIVLRRELDPVPLIYGNSSDLRRVFTNLILNAIEAMPEGGTLTVASEVAGRYVQVRVEDTGTGIAPEQQKRIFLPYFTTKAGGTGLGLSGAQKIVLAQGGDITFSSEPGKGTRFVVRLPASVLSQSEQAA